MALPNNSTAPDFTLPSTSGTSFNLRSDMQGKACVIYFYPKDFTSGCTAEACDFRDQHQLFSELDIKVFGISRDDMATHQRFKKQHNLPFDLLSDTTGEVCAAYDALIPLIKVPKRITYLLDKEHKIIATYSSMFDAAGHIKKMIGKLKLV